MSAGISTFADLKLDYSVTNMCGITMNDSVEGRAVAEVLEGKPGVTIKHYPAMIRIDAENLLRIDMNEVSENLGYKVDPYVFQIEMSTHYGRMVILDDAVELHAGFDATMGYIE
jgi:propane monooxygenase coupling protein